MQNKTSDTIEKINFFNIIHNTRLNNEIYDVNCSMSDYQNTPHNQTSHLYTNLTNVFYSAIPNSKEIFTSSIIMAALDVFFENTMKKLSGIGGGAFGKMIARDTLKTVPIVINVISDTKVQHTDFHYDISNIFSGVVKIACKGLVISIGSFFGRDVSSASATSNFLCEIPATFIRRLGEHKQELYNTTEWNPYLFEMWEKNQEDLARMTFASTVGSAVKIGAVFVTDLLLVSLKVSQFFASNIDSIQMYLSGALIGGVNNGVAHILLTGTPYTAAASIALFLVANLGMYIVKEAIYSFVLMTISSIAQRTAEEVAYHAADTITDHIVNPAVNYLYHHGYIKSQEETKKEFYYQLPKLNETDINPDDPLGIDHHNFNNESHYNILFDAQ